MDKAARKRWAILSSALLMTLAAMFYPRDELTVAHARPAVARTKQAKPPLALASSNSEDPLLGVERVSIDPFAPRQWIAPPPPAPVVLKPAVVQVAETPTLPVGPPPLPFRFVGSMNDNDEQVVYLGRGEQALVARNGETLEGTYKVLSITTQQIEFEHLPTGETQTLLFSSGNN